MKYLKTYGGFKVLNEELFGLFGSNGRKRYQKLVDKELISIIQKYGSSVVSEKSAPWKQELVQNINNEKRAKNILDKIKNESSLDGFISDLEYIKKIKSGSTETVANTTQSSQKEEHINNSPTREESRELRDFLGRWKKRWDEMINSEFVADIENLYNFIVWIPEFSGGLLQYDGGATDEMCESIKFLKLIIKYEEENLSQGIEELRKKVLSLREELFGEIKKDLPSFDIDNPQNRDKFFSRIDDNNPGFYLKHFLEEHNLFSRGEFYTSPIHKKLEFILENLNKFSSVSNNRELALAILRDKNLTVDRNNFVTYHGSDRENWAKDNFKETINLEKRKKLGLFTSDLKTAIRYAIGQFAGYFPRTKYEEGDKVSVYRITLGEMPFLRGNENELTHDEMNILLYFGFGGLDGIGATNKERETIIVTPDAIKMAKLISQDDAEFDKILDEVKREFPKEKNLDRIVSGFEAKSM